MTHSSAVEESSDSLAERFFTLLEAISIGRSVLDCWLFKGVSIRLCAGDLVTLQGPSGSGKTLLLRALAMLDPIDSGELLWQGNRICDRDVPSYRSQVMYVNQRPALIEGTVEDNLRQPFSLGVHRQKVYDSQRVLALLSLVGRSGAFLQKQHHDLSGGEAQLTCLLRAMLLNPTVLLLDEPTAALDAGTTAEVEDLLSRWFDDRPKERAVVWVTHDQPQAMRMGNSMLRILDGQLARDNR